MMSNGMQFFIDFDGTITKNDIVDLILDRFASSEWKKVEAEWVQGKIGSRECLSRQVALVSATREEVMQFILKMETDPHFVSFLRCAKKYGFPVTIVSDGFKIIIENILKRVSNENAGQISSLPVYSNQLEWTDGRVFARFPDGPACGHGCANCKASVIERHRIAGEKAIFVGDGLSDRFAAMVSDLTFAKVGANGRSPLLKFCEEKKINHEKYSTFKDIEKWLIRHSERSEESQKQDPSSASGGLRMTGYIVEKN